MSLDFFAGCLGGCAGVAVGHPLDTVKVKIQTQDFKNPIYRSTFGCFKHVVKNESVSALYKGMTSPMAGVAFINGLIFGVYGAIQRRLPNPDSILSVSIAGTAAGVMQSVLCSPMELVKTRVQVQKTQLYKNPFDCMKKIYRAHGLRGVFQGLNITALREGPGFGIYFLTYELLARSDEEIGTLRMLFAGGMAGSVSWLMAYPMDVIKSRIQIDGMYGPRQYKNSLDCFKQSVRSEGYGCLFRGVNTAIIRAFPTNAATWAVVNWTMRLLNQPNKDSTLETISQYLEKKKFEDFYLTKSVLSVHQSSLLNLVTNTTNMTYLPKMAEIKSTKPECSRILRKCSFDFELFSSDLQKI